MRLTGFPPWAGTSKVIGTSEQVGGCSQCVDSVKPKPPQPCRSCRRLRSFDLDFKDQKIAAFGSSYRGRDCSTCRGQALEKTLQHQMRATALACDRRQAQVIETCFGFQCSQPALLNPEAGIVIRQITDIAPG